MASNEYFSGPKSHATQKGSPAKLVAPAKAGRYEIRYFSYTNGAVLKKRALVVHQVFLSYKDRRRTSLMPPLRKKSFCKKTDGLGR
jgi:hypothetical protein